MMTLDEYRERIDQIDDALVKLLAHRFDATGKIGQIKAAGNLPPVAPEREDAQYQRLTALALEHNLPPDLLEKLFRTIIAEVVHQHQQLQSVPSKTSNPPHIHRDHTIPEVAPDGSTVRPLARCRDASHCHCVLDPGQVSVAVAHRTVDELWYCIAGTGEFYCQNLGPRPIPIHAGSSWHVPRGESFQFKNTSVEPLQCIITTCPPWPPSGAAEALPATSFW